MAKALGPILREFFNRKGHAADPTAIRFEKNWREAWKQYVADVYGEWSYGLTSAKEFGTKKKLTVQIAQELNDWPAYRDLYGFVTFKAAQSAIYSFISIYHTPKPLTSEQLREIYFKDKDIDAIIKMINERTREDFEGMEEYFDEEDMDELENFFTGLD